MFLLYINIDYLKLSDVARILKLKDNRSARNWLKENGVQVSKIGSSSVVNRLTFELKRQELLVEELMISYPNSWFKIYDAMTDEKKMVKAIAAIYPKKTTAKKGKNNSRKIYIK